MRRNFLTLTLLMLCSLSFGQQSVESLKGEIRRAEEEIKRNTALLKETQASRTAGQRELKLLLGRLDARRKILRALNNQISLFTSDLKKSRNEVDKMRSEREKLTGAYTDMIVESYRNYLLNNYLSFLFASRDFDDATRRIDYMRRYNSMREQRAEQIDSLTKVIAVHMAEVDAKLITLDSTRVVYDHEVKELAGDERQYNKMLGEMRSRESKISKDIASRQAQVKRAQQEIARVVAAEAKKSSGRQLTSEQLRIATELSGKFDQNRGKLPWPVRGGVIIDRYGLHAHPTQRGLTVDNKGVNIAGANGAPVTSVFEGVVANIFFYQGLNNNVMVRHGNYLTVYSNLASVSVKVGESVKLNQVLGRLAGSDTDENSLHFEIWKESVNLNPEVWLLP